MIKLNNEQATYVYNLLGSMATKSVEIDSLLENIRAQFDHPNHNRDMLDLVAELLASTKARLVMSPQLLSKLRSAILNPRELATVQALSKESKCCTACYRELVTGEMVSIHGNDIYCTKCVMPEVYSCGGCNKSLTMPTGINRILQKATKECPHCGTAAKLAATEAPAATQATPAPPAITTLPPDDGRVFYAPVTDDGTTWRVVGRPADTTPNQQAQVEQLRAFEREFLRRNTPGNPAPRARVGRLDR